MSWQCVVRGSVFEDDSPDTFLVLSACILLVAEIILVTKTAM